MVIVVDSPSWGPPETSDGLDRLLVPSGVTLGPPSVYRLGYIARGFEWACRWAGCLSLVELCDDKGCILSLRACYTYCYCPALNSLFDDAHRPLQVEHF